MLPKEQPFKYAVNANMFKGKLSPAEVARLCVEAGAGGVEWGL